MERDLTPDTETMARNTVVAAADKAATTVICLGRFGMVGQSVHPVEATGGDHECEQTQ